MNGWTVDVVGASHLLTALGDDSAELRGAVADVEDALERCAAALDGPVAAAFATFAAPRRHAPAELVAAVEAAAGAAAAAVAALATGNLEMAEQMRAARLAAGAAPEERGRGVVPL